MRRLLLAVALFGCRQMAVPAGGPPAIASFAASPASIVAGEPATLTWQVDEGAQVSIDNGVGDVSGRSSARVLPGGRTTYTLTARAGQWLSSATATVEVAAQGTAAAEFRVDPANAGPAANAPFLVRVTALDASGKVASLYRGTVTIGSGDAAAVLPAAVAFTQADFGVHDFEVTLRTAGAQTITATDGAAHGSASVTVAAGAPFLSFSGLPASSTAGATVSFALTAGDSFGNRAAGYGGKVHFNSTDPLATLPADSTFLPADEGRRVFSLTFATPGPQSISVQDDSAPPLTATSAEVVVGAGSATALSLDVQPATAIAGEQPVLVNVTALDALGNVDGAYAGTVHFTSTDPFATLPADSTLTNGKTGFPVLFATAGPQTVTVSDGTLSATTSPIVVSAGASEQIVLSALPSSATAGDSLSLTATVLDGSGNVVPGYAGTVHFTSTDANAALPADYTFTPADAGAHTFAFSFHTAGAQRVIISDGTLSPKTTGFVQVTAAAAARLAVTGLQQTSVAGQTRGFTVTAYDAFSNVATLFAAAVTFATGDTAALLPAPSTLTNGAGAFSVTFETAGAWSVTATGGGVSGNSSNCVVTAAAASHLALALPSSAIAGTAFTASVTALDPFGNTDAAYAGTLHFSSSDGAAVLPADSTLTSGAGSFAVTLDTAGSQSVSAGDGSISGGGSVAVSAGAATHFALTNLAPTSTAGVAQPFTLTAFDAHGNVATGYAGTVHFSSGDGAAALPADATLAGGAGAFSVTFKTAGAQTVTAADGGITGSASSQVSPAAASTCAMSGVPASTTTLVPFSPAVTFSDAFGNLATGYRGAVGFSSGDGAAHLPATYGYTAADGGAHTFTAWFGAAGTQTLTASDGTISCNASSTVSANTFDRYAFSGLAPSATAGVATAFTVTVQTAAGATDTAYLGTISFASTDAVASVPSNYTFTAADAGVHSFSVTFRTPGAQSISASDAANALIVGSGGPVTVHGLVYTDPAAGGRIRLVRNAASSGTTAVLDLVAGQALSGYFVGLDLPVDSTRVAAGSPAIAAGGALNPGLAPQAMAAALPGAGPLASIFVSGLSQKAAGAGAIATDASIATGQVFYTLRLNLAAGATPGTVFDGGATRASLRDRGGNEIAALADFAIGKLEVQ